MSVIHDELRPLTDDEQLTIEGRELQPYLPLKHLARDGLVTLVSLDIAPMEPTLDHYTKLGSWLGLMNRASVWWIGDWLLYGENRYGETWAQALAATGLTEETLRQRMSVCQAIPPSDRRAGVGFSLHHAVHRLPARQRNTLLRQAQEHGWTLAQMNQAIREQNRETTEPMFDGDDTVAKPSRAQLEEVARAILRDAEATADPGWWRIPDEDMARLRAALGVE